MIIASGEITITDVNDAKQLSMYIGASQPKVVIYDSISTYTPNYSTSNQVLTPQLFVAGTNIDIASEAQSVKWFYQTNSTGAKTEITASGSTYELGTGAVKTLTIKSNVLASNNTMAYTCEMVYEDPTTGLDIPTIATIELVKVSNGTIGQDGEAGADGENAIFLNVWTPEGNTIKNNQGTVKCRADLYSGVSTVVANSYKWYVQDPTATTVDGGDAEGGNGWRLLDGTYNGGISGYTTSEIIVPSTMIAGMESFKVIANYNGNSYIGVTTAIDLADPIMVRLDGADKFRNGQGTNTVRATLIRNGMEIDADGSLYAYEWFIYDKEGIQTGFSAIGKVVTIDSSDIGEIGLVVCQVSE